MFLVFIVLLYLINLYSLKKYHVFSKINSLLLIILYLIILYFTKNKEIIDVLYLILLLIPVSLIIFVDSKEYWIPDLSILIILFNSLFYYFIKIKFYFSNINFSGLIISVIFILIILLLEFLMKKELIGFGDLKLLFVISLNQNILFISGILIISSFLGIMYYLFLKILKKEVKMIAYGPHIIIAWLILLLIIK